MSGFNLGDYVDVKTRIRLFYDKYPDGRLTTEAVSLSEDPDGKVRVWAHARAYRTPEDNHPGDGWSWLEVPGATSYTRGSEIENAETSAWGRAIGALGIGIDKGIASGDEIQSKRADGSRPETIIHETRIGRATNGNPRVFTGMAVRWQMQGLDGQIRMDPDDVAHYGFVLECEDQKKRHVHTEGDLALMLAMANPIGQVVKAVGPYRVEELPKKDGGTYKAGVLYATNVTAPDGTPLIDTAPAQPDAAGQAPVEPAADTGSAPDELDAALASVGGFYPPDSTGSSTGPESTSTPAASPPAAGARSK